MVLVAAEAEASQGLRSLLEEAHRAGATLRRVPRSEIDALGLSDHQGVAAMVTGWLELGERDLLTMPFGVDALVVVLDGIMDPQNLGACARAAEAAGASLLVSRRRRAAPVTPAAIRASAGALAHLPVAVVPNLRRAIEHLKDRGFTVMGLDHRARLDIHSTPVPERPLAVVAGGEERGISRLVAESCDLLVSIPMPGRTASLNAAAALAVGLFGFALRPAK